MTLELNRIYCGDCLDLMREMEQHQGRDRADLMEKIRELETEISEVKRYVQYGIDELEFI